MANFYDNFRALLGFRVKETGQPDDTPKTFVPPAPDGSFVLDTGGIVRYGINQDIEMSLKTEAELIRKYREVAKIPEADQAICDICDQAIIMNEIQGPVNIKTDNIDHPAAVKKAITAEFENILKLLDFNKEGYDIFRKWYIDGRLFYQILVNPNKQKDGIKELRQISPFRIKPVTEINRIQFNTRQGTIQLIDDETDYFFYTDETLRIVGKGLKIAKDSICYVNSGLVNEDKNMVEGYLHVALKPANQLRMIEDAIVIYRLSRAPERRVFYIDVGTLPKIKAEEYVKTLMTKYKNRLTYDPTTGATADTSNVMSLQEDFWLPRREGSKGTEIDTLQAGQNLGEIQDIQYFLKKFYKALNVPTSRLEDSGGTFNFGRSPEITRDELKFAKFIDRLRARFSDLFLVLLRIQLILKGVITEDEWNEIKHDLWFEFTDDAYFAEIKNSEIWKERITNLSQVNEFIGTYFSKNWVQKNVLQMSDDEIEEMDKEIQDEVKNQTIAPDAGTAPGVVAGQPAPVAMPGQPEFGGDLETPPSQDQLPEDEEQEIDPEIGQVQQ